MTSFPFQNNSTFFKNGKQEKKVFVIGLLRKNPSKCISNALKSVYLYKSLIFFIYD